MSIEGSKTVASHKPVAGDASRSGKARGVAGGAEAESLAGAGGGFFALLNSFDSEIAVEDATTVQSVMDQPVLTQPQSVDPLVNLPPQSFPNDLALLLAQASEVSADKFSSPPVDGPNARISSASNLTPLAADLAPLPVVHSSIVPTDLSTGLSIPRLQTDETRINKSNPYQGDGQVSPMLGVLNLTPIASDLSSQSVEQSSILPSDLSTGLPIPSPQTDEVRVNKTNSYQVVGQMSPMLGTLNLKPSASDLSSQSVVQSSIMPTDLSIGLPVPSSQTDEARVNKTNPYQVVGQMSPMLGTLNLTPIASDLLSQSVVQSSILPINLPPLLVQTNEGVLDQSTLSQASLLANSLPGSVISPFAESLPKGPVTTSSSVGAVAATSGNFEALRTVNSLNPTDGFTPPTVPVDFVPARPQQGRPFKNNMTESLSSTVSGLGEQRLQSLSVLQNDMSRDPSLGDMLLSSGLGERLIRQGDSRNDKPSFSSASGSAAEAIWGQQSFQAGSVTETAAAMVDSSSSSMESMVAETVSYWVSQGVKHAALKLDGFGDQPLEVNISMQGGETHIDFRTDQPEIRQILEGAMPQLKDLLKSDGLVLAGVSVGASGQNGAGSQDGRDRPGARQSAALAMVDGSSEDGSRRVSQPTGRVLDLFV